MQQTTVENYWNRPGGMGEVLRMALPLIVSTIAWTLMNFIDRVLLMWYSADAVGAALAAGMVSFTVICLPLGVAGYVNTFVAQYYGARRFRRIGVVVWQGVFLGLATVPAALASAHWIPQLFTAAGHDPAIVQLESAYYTALSFGAGAIVISGALAAFFTGRGQVVTVMAVDSLGAAVNIALDYAWIFGHWGFPEGGIAGAGWATSLATWFRTLLYLLLFLRPACRRVFHSWSGLRFDGSLLLRLVRFGTPSGLQMLVEVGALSGFILLVGWLGPEAMTATSLAFNVNNLAFMPVWGIGMATATLVGQWIGRGRPDVAARATWAAFTLATAYMLLISAAYLWLPGPLLWAYSVGADQQQFARLSETTAVLMQFLAAFCLFDGMNIVFSSAIKGAGDMRFVFLATLATAGMPVVGPWLGIAFLDWGLYGAWLAMTLWVIVLGVIYLCRFLQGRWRSMRVIEPTCEASADEAAQPADSPTGGQPAPSAVARKGSQAVLLDLE